MRKFAAIGAAVVLAGGIAACGGDDDEDSGSGDTEETASAETVTVTTGDTEDGYSWEVEPTPTTETTTIEYVNESEEPHALVFAKINEGYTLEEAYEAQGRKGTAELLVESDEKTSPGPGETTELEVEGPVEPGDDYVLLCPIPGHYQQGQLEEFSIE